MPDAPLIKTKYPNKFVANRLRTLSFTASRLDVKDQQKNCRNQHKQNNGNKP
jgi:hypothetical protein